MNTQEILNRAEVIRYVENTYPEANQDHKNKLVNILLNFKRHLDREEEEFNREFYQEQNQ